MDSSIRQLERKIAKSTSLTERIDAMNSLSWAINDHDPDQALSLSQKALNLSEDGGLPAPYIRGLADSLRNIAFLHYQSSNYDSALQAGFKGLDLYRQLNEVTSQCMILRLLGRIYESLASYPDALAYELDAIDLCEKHNDDLGIALSLSHVGMIYHRIGDFEQELEVYQKALNIYENLDEPRGLAQLYNQMASSILSQKDSIGALSYAQKSIDLAQEYAYEALEAEVHKTLGTIYVAQGGDESALLHLQQSVAMSQRLGFRKVEIDALIAIANLFYSSTKAENALMYLRRALMLAEDADMKREQYRCHEFLAKIYRESGLHEFAYDHFVKFHKIERLVRDEKAEQALKNLRVQYETESARKEAEIYELKNVALEYEIIERLRAEEAMQVANDSLASKVAELSLLSQISHVLTTAFDLNREIKFVVGMVADLMQVNGAVIGIPDHDMTCMHAVSTYRRDEDSSYSTEQSIMLDESAWALNMMEKDEPQYIMGSDAQMACGRIFANPIDPDSYLYCIPLHARSGKVGLLGLVIQDDDQPFMADKQKLMTTVAGQIAISLENTRLFEEEQMQRIVVEKRNKELDTFARTVAHNLQNPISALVGSTEFLSEYHSVVDQKKLAEMLQVVHNGGVKALSIIDELLLLAGLRQQDVVTQPLDMRGILSQVEQRLSMFMSHYEGELIIPERWPICVGYGPWVEEVWANYISNGVKYGGRPFRLELGATIVDENMIRYWVRDNGDGIGPDAAETLFTEFNRLAPDRANGHGLGLAIVKRIVQRLDGDVGVYSTPGEGSVFYFTLPAANLKRAEPN